MKISIMVSRVNQITGSGSFGYQEMLMALDECVDVINEDLGISLPLISDVYENNFVVNEYEIADELEFTNDSEENEYTRIPDAYIRNFVCHEVAYKLLTQDDEPEEVTMPKLAHARNWYKKLKAVYSNFTLEDTESITLNGDVDELEGVIDDTVLGYYNPYADTD